MINKEAVSVNFAQGLDTKTDPKQLSMGKFLRLENMVFDKGGLLKKRNGYGSLAALPNASSGYLTTFNGSLTAAGTSLSVYNSSNNSWVSKGNIQPLRLSTTSLIRNNLNQTQVDSAIAANGLLCTVYTEVNGGTTTHKFAIANSVTGQNIVAPRTIPVSSGNVTGSARVFVLGTNFIIVFTNVIAATSHLQYIAISSIDTTVMTTNANIAASYVSSARLSWDGVVVNNNLYIAYNTTSGGQSVKVTYLSKSLALQPAVTFAGKIAALMSLTGDLTNPANPIIWVTFHSGDGWAIALDQNLNTISAPTQYTLLPRVVNLATAAQNGILTIFMEFSNTYSWDATVPTNFINAVTVTVAGALSSPYDVVRSVGLASKAFIVSGVIYFLSAYQSQYQSTYFLINGSASTSASPVIVAKLAYSNGGGYLSLGLPGVSISGVTAHIAYLFKDLIQAVNKNTAVPSGTQVSGIYSQTGINLGSFEIDLTGLNTVEIGNNLHLSGGFLSMYDGFLPVEHNFFLWPDTDQTNPTDTATWSAVAGNIAAQPDGATNANAYFYQFTYEWTDNQGNAFRSAPSIPIAVTTTGMGSTGTITLNIPMIRLTMKVSNPVKIVIYRWSVAQQIYYQTTSITAPILNDTTIDSIAYNDTNADATILGNNVLYTTGGVVEDVNAPASNILSLFDSRLWLVDAENPNLLWYSKQVIQSTPVEMSDLFTVFIPPTTATEGITGPVTALSPMDDKLVIFKENAILYLNGFGPDNTGANNQYSQPIFVTSTVGCTNQRSIVLTPTGLMFQSNKGIWLLDRGMNTSYIGSGVEEFNGSLVNSAVNVPATNQVRFTQDNGISLMYDYFYGQWGTFVGVPAVSSTIFNGMHTFINSFGAAYKETSDQYLDGSNPVLMAFKTGPLRLGDLQNYQRAYFFYILGTFLSPHKLYVSVSYDYEDNPSQSVIISPTNYSTPYGSGPSQSPYGQGTPYGGGTNLESWRVFLERQRCMAFGIEVQEIFDSTFGTAAGAGLTISGLNIVMGFKSKFLPQSSANSIG